MANTTRQNILLGDPIYTLAQSGTNNHSSDNQTQNIIVYGNGTDTSNQKAMKGKAKRKMITQKLMLAIIDVLREKGEYHRSQEYWNAYHCHSDIVSSNGRTYGTYCKTRYCLVCCANRKAEIVNRYLPIIEQWSDPHFVTLTEKSVPEQKLNLWFRAVKVAFKRILEKHKKRHQRNKGPKFMGIKSLECNFNPKKRTYNPHLHLIVPNREVADILKMEWLKTWNTKTFLASHKAQDIKRVTNNKKVLIEIIKYSSKIFTDPDMKKKNERTRPPVIYAAAMDNIFCAMKPYRIFDRFGFNCPKGTKVNTGTKRLVSNFDELSFDLKAFDWINTYTGEMLSGHIPTPQLHWLLEHNIDKTSN